MNFQRIGSVFKLIFDSFDFGREFSRLAYNNQTGTKFVCQRSSEEVAARFYGGNVIDVFIFKVK